MPASRQGRDRFQLALHKPGERSAQAGVPVLLKHRCKTPVFHCAFIKDSRDGGMLAGVVESTYRPGDWAELATR
jgi:hypothetical protein